MKNHFFIFLLRILLIFVAGNNVANATCLVDPDDHQMIYNYDFGNIIVPPNARVGDVLATMTQGDSNDTSIECNNDPGTVSQWMIAPWTTLTSVSYTYATNIPGVGIKITTMGGWPYSDNGNPRQWTTRRMMVGGANVYLIKTDEILNGGALNTGLVGEVRDDFNNNPVQVVLTNATISLPACNFNNGNPIDVDFGSAVAVTDVAAGTVEKSIDYTLTCTYDNYGLKMKILGTPASFDNDLLKTDINEMGIKITANGTALPLNTDLNFASAAAKPALKAILTQQPGARLPTGAFTASATMRVEYQ
jgi:type 1 fimbria pilin